MMMMLLLLAVVGRGVPDRVRACPCNTCRGSVAEGCAVPKLRQLTLVQRRRRGRARGRRVLMADMLRRGRALPQRGLLKAWIVTGRPQCRRRCGHHQRRPANWGGAAVAGPPRARRFVVRCLDERDVDYVRGGRADGGGGRGGGTRRGEGGTRRPFAGAPPIRRARPRDSNGRRRRWRFSPKDCGNHSTSIATAAAAIKSTAAAAKQRLAVGIRHRRATIRTPPRRGSGVGKRRRSPPLRGGAVPTKKSPHIP